MAIKEHENICFDNEQRYSFLSSNFFEEGGYNLDLDLLIISY